MQICSEASEKNLTSWRDFLTHAHDACNVSIAIAGQSWHRDWVGYNGRRNSVRHGDKSDGRVLFHRTGSIPSDKSRSIGLFITNAAKALQWPVYKQRCVPCGAILTQLYSVQVYHGTRNLQKRPTNQTRQFFGQLLNFSHNRQQPKWKRISYFLKRKTEFISSSEMKCPKSVFY